MAVVVVVLDMLLLLAQATLHLLHQVKETMVEPALLMQIMVLVAVAGLLRLAVMEQPQQAVTVVTEPHHQSLALLLLTLAVAVVRCIHQAPQELEVLAAAVTAMQLFQPQEPLILVVVAVEGEAMRLELAQQAALALSS